MGLESHSNDTRRIRNPNFYLAMLLTSSFVATATLSSPSTVAAQDAAAPQIGALPNRPAIPFCDENAQDRTIGRRLLYITTLDGRLSALDITQGGQVHWSIATGPGALISSSIHRLELTNNGQFVRMIPSLSGGIYKFDGESIDPIPITTEHLLSSSAKFSDDLVISGGKETRTYGVSARTGQLLYECSMDGCTNVTTTAEPVTQTGGSDTLRAPHDPLIDDVVVVRRQTQTVRAVESRTGIERWNFSVGQHDLDIIRAPECHDRPFSDLDMAILDLDVKVIVPEGVICAFSKADPSAMLWKHQFDHPIVSAWKIGADDELEPIDMFGSAQWLWANLDDSMFDSPYPSSNPSIYLGMYEKQLYIQESVNLRREIVDQSNLYTHLTTDEPHLPRIPWRPIAASSNALVLFRDDKTLGPGVAEIGTTTLPASPTAGQGHELVPYDEESFSLSAQSVLNGSEYVNGNGFYFYLHDDFAQIEGERCEEGTHEEHLPAIEAGAASDVEYMGNETNRTLLPANAGIVDDLGFSLDDIDAPVKVVILSLWFWWKEIAVIAFTTAVLLNFFMAQRQRMDREIVVIERHIPVPIAMEATESSTGLVGSSGSGSKGGSKVQRSLSESTSHSGEHFSSRFQGDFDLVRCLGRGGFGVVFEAQNKLDDCRYAVKRITLPNRKESRERVMREVKTLANCEHHNIVRYFQAWVETPPPGWQEEEDSKWLAHGMSTSIQIETPDGTTLPSSFASGAVGEQQLSRVAGHYMHQHHEKKSHLLSWVSNVTSVACSSDHDHDSDIAEGDEGEEDEDDSCIVFRTESQSLEMRADVNNCSSASYSDVGCRRNGDGGQLKGSSAAKSIAIDIHSSSFDMNLTQDGRKVDFSTQLSDSFQIEFERPVDDEGNSVEHVVAAKTNGYLKGEGAKETASTNSGRTRRRRLRRPNSLLLKDNERNSNTSSSSAANKKALLPALGVPPPKPVQNKVFLYIQMQLCRKESLRDWLRDNRSETRECHIGSIFHQIVDAVDYVHLKGLIHRDLKPSNIFFSQDGQIKIGDFGLVTDMSDIPNMVTKCGDGSGLPSCARHTQQVGTHLYMSPEQLRGEHYDYKVDIYSLGLIFFELLVYFGTEMERIVTLRDLRDGRYPRNFAEERSKEYELLQQMLSAQALERPATAELKRQLLGILHLPEAVGDADEAALVAAAARRLSRSRTLSTTTMSPTIIMNGTNNGTTNSSSTE